MTTDYARQIVRCSSCYYVLNGVASRRCPECGHALDPADPATFDTAPPPTFLPRHALLIYTALYVAAAIGYLFALICLLLAIAVPLDDLRFLALASVHFFLARLSHHVAHRGVQRLR